MDELESSRVVSLDNQQKHVEAKVEGPGKALLGVVNRAFLKEGKHHKDVVDALTLRILTLEKENHALREACEEFFDDEPGDGCH